MCNCIGWSLLSLSIAAFIGLYGLVVVLPEDIINTHRGYVESGETIVAFNNNNSHGRSRILTSSVHVPDYWATKSLSLLFFAHVKTEMITRPLQFALECRALQDKVSAETNRTLTFRHSFGHSDNLTRALLYRRNRVPTPLIVPDSMCMLVVIPPYNQSVVVPAALTIEWRIQLLPRWHWTDWFPRVLTDEYYRAMSLIGLYHYNEYAVPDLWYGGMGLNKEDDEEDDEERNGLRYMKLREMQRIFQTLYDAQLDAASTDEK